MAGGDTSLTFGCSRAAQDSVCTAVCGSVLDLGWEDAGTASSARRLNGGACKRVHGVAASWRGQEGDAGVMGVGEVLLVGGVPGCWTGKPQPWHFSSSPLSQVSFC